MSLKSMFTYLYYSIIYLLQKAQKVRDGVVIWVTCAIYLVEYLGPLVIRYKQGRQFGHMSRASDSLSDSFIILICRRLRDCCFRIYGMFTFWPQRCSNLSMERSKCIERCQIKTNAEWLCTMIYLESGSENNVSSLIFIGIYYTGQL